MDLVVGEIDGRPQQRFTAIQLLLGLQDMEVEEVLQALVGKVDTKLLKRVVFEDFESENVQNANPCKPFNGF